MSIAAFDNGGVDVHVAVNVNVDDEVNDNVDVEGGACVAHPLPVRREQTVHFDEGDMRVVEEFDWR